MANNYLQSSSMFLIPENKHELAREIIDRFMATFDDELDDYCSIEVELEKDGVWIHGEDSFDPEQAADLVQMLMVELEIDEPFVFSWAYTCSKPRIDEFGGGAALVRRGQATAFIDAFSHMLQIIEDQENP